ncbi:MAG: hypothetical protein ABIH04_07675 [Planctomycetota bacterium]
MTKKLTIITVIAAFAFLWISSEAFPYTDKWGVPSWMQPFADPQPVYKFDWAFSHGGATADINGKWISTNLTNAVGESRGDGTAYTGEAFCYWTAISDQINGFSVSNDIGDWIAAIGSGQATIRWSIREDYSGGGVDNNDVVELYDNATELVVMRGYAASGANLGVGSDDDITALEWNTEFDDENLVFDHRNSINDTYYRSMVWVDRNMDDETVYMTFGAYGNLAPDGSTQTGTERAFRGWAGGNYYTYTMLAHHADICYETRTYNPIVNADGPQSPYEWLYDASGDMYVPTDTTAHPTPSSDPETRAFELIGNHPYWVNDDTSGECDAGDSSIWHNQVTGIVSAGTAEGVLARGVFVDSWRLAGELLGDEFWTTAGNVWDPADGRVEDGSGNPVANHDELNTFMRYVFDIDALVVEDNGVEGEFDEGDYVLFSVVDDGLYEMYQEWGVDYAYVSSLFDGEYFDGDTIFLYDGTSVTTFFDAGAGIFFGQTSSAGDGTALWGGAAYYDIDALDIGILPEPSTIFLMIGSASGLAVVAGIMRRKMR